MFESILPLLMGFLLLLGGGKNHGDLLDAMSTDVYWKIKNVAPNLEQLLKDAGTDAAPASIDSYIKDLGSADFATRDKAHKDLERMGPPIIPLLKPAAESQDAEVAAVAQELIREFNERGEERAIRRLMAIRTLGERKEKEALPQLTALKDSTELFVAQYARRAMAQINGEQPEVMDVTSKLPADLALMPADSMLVAQTIGLGKDMPTIANLIPRAVTVAMQMGDGMPPGANARKPDIQQMIRKATDRMLTVVERVGNIRFDSLTYAMNYDQADAPDAVEKGWSVLILRGEYDALRVADALRQTGDENVYTPAEKPGDVAMIIDKNGGEALLMPSNQMLIYISGASKEQIKAAVDTTLAALKNGKGTLADNKDLAGLMQTVDVKSPAWLVAKLPPSLSKQAMDLQTITIETKITEKGADIVSRCQVADEDKAKAMSVMVEGQVQDLAKEIAQEVASEPVLKPMVDMIGTVVIATDGKAMTVKATLPDAMLDPFLAYAGEFGLLSLSDDAPDAVQPQQPVNVPPETQPALPAGNAGGGGGQ